MLPKLPNQATIVLNTIADAGGQGFLVGGALRDLLMGTPPHDWDFAATLPPAELLRLFPNARAIGGACGTVRLPFGANFCEITPCRTEGGYADKRHPDEVTFVPNILEDLSRRDFTVNAMAYDGQVLFDPYGGQQDIARKLLRCVGEPAERFAEDPLRVLRLYRFMAQLGFGAEKATLAAAMAAVDDVQTLSPGRVYEEVTRMLYSREPQVLGMLVAAGALRSYGFHFAPALAPLAEVPATRLCRWWAFMALCGADVHTVAERFGFARRFVKDLDECTRLYRLGPSQNRTALKLKLRGTMLRYNDVAVTFAAISPAFAAEPALYAVVRAKREPFRLAHLAVDGEMLAENGVKGRQCGRILDELLVTVIKNPALNVRPVLLGLAREIQKLL